MDLFVTIVWYLSYVLTVVGFLALLNRGLNYIRAKVVESKVNVSGEYISEYEYVDNEKKVTRKAIANFKQKGTKITGSSYYHGLDQSFSFKAELIDHTRVSGYYESTNLKHKAYGNLFLELRLDDVLEGTWSGYDGLHNIINGGKYTFYPILRDHTIVPMQENHVQYVFDICENTLGKGRMPLQYFKKCFDNNTPTFGLSVLYHDKKNKEKRIVGVLTGTIGTPKTYFDVIKTTEDVLPDAVGLSSKIGWIDIIAVHPDYQKKGLGTKLVQAFERKLKAEGVHVFLAYANKHKNRSHLAGTLELLNYTKATEYESILRLTNGSNGCCLICGEKPCECTSEIYYKLDLDL